MPEPIMTTTWSQYPDSALEHANLALNHRLDNEYMTPTKRALVEWILGDLHTEMALRLNAKGEVAP